MCILNDQGGSCMDVSEDITGTLRAQEHGHQPIVAQSAGFCPEQSAKTRGVGYEDEKSPTLRAGVVPGMVLSFEPGITSRLGRKGTEEISSTLRADMGDNQVAVVIENHPSDSRVKIKEDGIVQTLDARMGMGGGNVPLVCEPKTLKIRSGCEGGGKGALIQDNLSATLSTSNDQTVFVPTAYGISSYESNAMKSGNPNSGVYEAETARTLDTGGGNPGCNQGGIAVVFDGKQITSKGNRSNPQPGDPCHTLASGSADSAYCIQGNMIGRELENGPQGDGVNEDVCFTLTGQDRHGVAYGIDRAAFNQGANAQYKPQIDVEKSATIVAKGPNAVAHPAYAMTTGSYMQVCEETAPTLQARDYKDAPAAAQRRPRHKRPDSCFARRLGQGSGLPHRELARKT